jgi:beta-glucanase (GH16 family)
VTSLAFAASAALPTDAAAATSRPQCGAKVPKSSGGVWECTFADGFHGDALNRENWVAQRTEAQGYANGRTACFVDRRDNIRVARGRLKLIAREEPSPFTCKSPNGDFETRYTSGMVSTAEGRFSQTYGRFEFRARISSAKVRGLHSALWLYPEKLNYGAWPTSGEIDVAEMYSLYPDRAVPFIHYRLAEPDPSVTNNWCMIEDLASFHTYTAEWTKTEIKIIYDGRICVVHKLNPAYPLTSSQPFDQPFIVVLTQALGVGTNEFDPETTPLPAKTVVDYVRVWR